MLAGSTRKSFLAADSASDSVIADPQMIQDTGLNGFPLVKEALDQSQEVARFDTGWPVQVREVVPGYQSRDFQWAAGGAAIEVAQPSCMTGR